MGKHGIGERKFHFFNLFSGTYDKIKEDEERRQKSVLFGLLAILLSCVCAATFVRFVLWGVKIMKYGFTHFLGPWTYFLALGNIFVALGGLAIMFLPFYLSLQGIELVVMQFFMNKRFIRWLALVVWLACLACAFYFTFDTISVLTGYGHLFT